MKHPATTPTRPTVRLRSACMAMCLFAVAGGFLPVPLQALAKTAQPDGTRDNPVFVNDSPAASDALVRAQENVAGGNLDQAVRVLQKLLDEDPWALVPSVADPTLFVCVRSRVHELLLGDQELLALYRRVQEPLAATATPTWLTMSMAGPCSR